MIWLPLTILGWLWTALQWLAVLILIVILLAFVLGGVKTLQWLVSVIWPRKPDSNSDNRQTTTDNN